MQALVKVQKPNNQFLFFIAVGKRTAEDILWTGCMLRA